MECLAYPPTLSQTVKLAMWERITFPGKALSTRWTATYRVSQSKQAHRGRGRGWADVGGRKTHGICYIFGPRPLVITLLSCQPYSYTNYILITPIIFYLIYTYLYEFGAVTFYLSAAPPSHTEPMPIWVPCAVPVHFSLHRARRAHRVHLAPRGAAQSPL